MRRTAVKLLSGTLLGACVLTLALWSQARPAALSSGVEKGGMLSAFEPAHVTGPDRGTNTCPVCKYPANPAVQVWINDDDPKNVAALVAALDKTARQFSDRRLKAFVVFINPAQESSEAMSRKLSRLASEKKVETLSLVYLPGPRAEAVSSYKINTDPKVKNTIFVYKNRKVENKFVNLTADTKGLDALNSAIRGIL